MLPAAQLASALAGMSRRRRLSSSPLDDDDLLREILLRLSPKLSSGMPASLVCTRWHGVLSDPQFLDRFRKHRRKAPLLGFFTEHVRTGHVFNPARIPDARFSLPWSLKPYKHWHLCGCRHGLAVLASNHRREAVVWDPLTGQHRRVPFPQRLRDGKTGRSCLSDCDATAMCADADDGHVHGNCFASPFKLVLVCIGRMQTFACVYRSASGVWGDVVSTTTTTDSLLSRHAVLIENAVYWLFRQGRVLAFHIEKQSLGVIDKPADCNDSGYRSFQLFRTAEDGSLGLAAMSNLSIQLWKRQSNSNGVIEWVLLQKTIQLQGLFPPRRDLNDVQMVGYDEDSNEIVLDTYLGQFMLQMESMHFTLVCQRYSCITQTFYPYRNFYTAGTELGLKWANLEL